MISAAFVQDIFWTQAQHLIVKVKDKKAIRTVPQSFIAIYLSYHHHSFEFCLSPRFDIALKIDCKFAQRMI